MSNKVSYDSKVNVFSKFLNQSILIILHFFKTSFFFLSWLLYPNIVATEPSDFFKMTNKFGNLQGMSKITFYLFHNTMLLFFILVENIMHTEGIY